MTPAPKRRWFRFGFSLRTLFVVVTAAATGFSWIAWNMQRVVQRQALLDSLADRYAILWNGSSDPPLRSPPLGWLLFGAKFQEYITLQDGLYSQDDLDNLATLFPESKVYHATSEEWLEGKDGNPVDPPATH